MRTKVFVATLLFPVVALATPPYDVTASFDPPDTGGPVEEYRFYVDDCAVTGAVGAPAGVITSGQTLTALLPADGTYQVCVRTANAAGERPDPGPVATVTAATLPLPGPIRNLSIQVDCPAGSCTIDVSVQP